jgi:hypothetical protein
MNSFENIVSLVKDFHAEVEEFFEENFWHHQQPRHLNLAECTFFHVDDVSEYRVSDVADYSREASNLQRLFPDEDVHEWWDRPIDLDQFVANRVQMVPRVPCALQLECRMHADAILEARELVRRTMDFFADIPHSESFRGEAIDCIFVSGTGDLIIVTIKKDSYFDDDDYILRVPRHLDPEQPDGEVSDDGEQSEAVDSDAGERPEIDDLDEDAEDDPDLRERA